MNLADVAVALAPTLAALQDAASGVVEERIADAQAERGDELLTEMFATATAPSGAPWLAPAHDYGHPLLDAAGELKASGTCEPGPRVDAAGHEITFSFSDEKATWQHFGTHRGGRAPSGTRRKSGAEGTPYYGAAEAQHIPPRHLLPAPGEEDRWRGELDITGQAVVDGWLTDNVRV